MASEPAAAVPGGGAAGVVACRPCHQLAFLPPSPRPPSPQGKGETYGYFMQGASPLASPRLNPGGTGFSFGKQCPKGGLVPGVVGWLCCTGAQGGVCLSPRLPTMPFVCRFSPIPPSPFPTGRGRPRLFHARGFAPCSPEAEPGRHGLFLWKTVPQGGLVPGVAGWLCCAGARGGLACFVACLPCHLFTVFPPSPRPRSQSALPSGKGETKVISCKGLSPLAAPRLNPGGTGFSFGKQCPKGGLVPGVAGWLCCTGAQGGVSFASPAYHAICLPFSPIPPSPFPSRGRGRLKVISCKGLRPLHPRHLTACGTYRACQAGTRRRESPRLGAKSTEPPFYWRCRQPRRGGTGGDGTIRRKRRRRLRWSSPPGQGEPMPHGYKPDSKPTAKAAKPILQSPKSQPPSDTAREP